MTWPIGPVCPIGILQPPNDIWGMTRPLGGRSEAFRRCRRRTPGRKSLYRHQLVAQARAEGYAPEPAHHERHPYFGYYYKILTRQGGHARGGARNYISPDGRMTGGFALLAYPATYGDSGIMTFIVNRSGIVFEKNLGTHTVAAARAIREYDPDPSWRPASAQAR